MDNFIAGLKPNMEKKIYCIKSKVSNKSFRLDVINVFSGYEYHDVQYLFL